MFPVLLCPGDVLSVMASVRSTGSLLISFDLFCHLLEGGVGTSSRNWALRVVGHSGLSRAPSPAGPESHREPEVVLRAAWRPS